MTRSVSSRENNLTTQDIDNHPGSASEFDVTVVANPTKVDKCVQIENKKQHNVIKEKSTLPPQKHLRNKRLVIVTGQLSFIESKRLKAQDSF